MLNMLVSPCRNCARENEEKDCAARCPQLKAFQVRLEKEYYHLGGAVDAASVSYGLPA